MRAHAESINLQFASPLNENVSKGGFEESSCLLVTGVVVIDDRASNHFLTPLEVSNKDDVAVGRIRRNKSQDGNHGLDIFVCGDKYARGCSQRCLDCRNVVVNQNLTFCQLS
ncbi:Aspartate-semialdehyde dehydrogenase, beta-type [Artemisia annua]|uniref:Aspartate-semialdehyde dehydrogenase, beta-type n=1 Tax=Artemisia annua TaxID=35608 RepID=A0A2U1PCA2_ARTAN|nr:Aspartate-semialdehyde dehydrogenase, beta-type [Artemisia annua]